MSSSLSPLSSLFTKIDVNAGNSVAPANASNADQTQLLSQILQQLEKQSSLLEQLLHAVANPQRQRQVDLENWRKANPDLADRCKESVQTLTDVHSNFLREMTDEIDNHADVFSASEMLFGEFVDRFGPRLAHLNGVLQFLAQLSPPPPKPEAAAPG